MPNPRRLTRLALLAAAALAIGSIARIAAGDAEDALAPTRAALVAQWVQDLASPDTNTMYAADQMLRCEGAFARDAVANAAADPAAPPAVRERAAKLVADIEGRDALPPADVKTMVWAMCHAKSPTKDPTAPGGFGPSINPPRKIDRTAPAHAGPATLYLLAATDETAPTPDGKSEGFALYLINRSNARVAIGAADSRLSLIREAKDAAGQWKPLETLPTFCGNSYHRVLLNPAEGWRFVVPVYTGPMKTTMRFTLLPARPGQDAQPKEAIHSNEFEGWVNPGQFEAKAGR